MLTQKFTYTPTYSLIVRKSDIKESDTNKICPYERLVMNFEGVVVSINAQNKQLTLIIYNKYLMAPSKRGDTSKILGN